MSFGNSVHDNQTAILRWLMSRGHRVTGLDEADTKGFHERRSCKTKKRFDSFADAAREYPLMKRYECKFCGGWHIATPR